MNLLSQFITDWFSHSPALVLAPSVQFTLLVAGLYLFLNFTKVSLKTRNRVLLVFSLYFYYRLAGLGILLLLIISVTDYFTGIKISNAKKESGKRALMFLSVSVSLAALFCSKYLPAISPSFINSGVMPEYFISVIGISYYVFKSVAYTVSIYREIIEEPEADFEHYLLYLSFFPTIVAGPISQPADLLSQLRNKNTISREDESLAFLLLLTGLAKKIVIADILSFNFLDKVFESPAYFSSTEAMIAFIASPVQVYYDFSGYTDIALGTALLFGFRIKDNFNFPFRALSLQDFWRRWHITLLDWLNLFVYSPLTLALRNLRLTGTILSVLLTFAISGIWHGASLVFFVWGIMHGIFMSVELLIRKLLKTKKDTGLFTFLWAMFTYIFLCLSFVVFKSPELNTALMLIEKALGGINLATLEKWISEYTLPGLILLAGIALHYLPLRFFRSISKQFCELHWIWQSILLCAGFYLIYQFSSVETKPFIYLEF